MGKFLGKIDNCFFLFCNVFCFRIMKCKKTKAKVLDTVRNCTVELQVSHDGKTMYVTPGSRVLQETYNIQECKNNDFGDVFQVNYFLL